MAIPASLSGRTLSIVLVSLCLLDIVPSVVDKGWAAIAGGFGLGLYTVGRPNHTKPGGAFAEAVAAVDCAARVIHCAVGSDRAGSLDQLVKSERYPLIRRWAACSTPHHTARAAPRLRPQE